MTAALKYRVTWTDPSPLRKTRNSRVCRSGRAALKFARAKARNPKHRPVAVEARRNGKLDQRWTV